MEWKTSVSKDGEDAEIRGEPLMDVAEMEFSDAIYLVLTGEKPSEQQSEIFRTIMSISIDHGVGNPSTVAARTVQSGGNPMNAGVAAGVLALGDRHGGAIQDCMEMLQSGLSAEEVVVDSLGSDRKIPGIGHKIYSEEDPRASRIFEKADELGVAGKNCRKMREIRREFADRKLSLPVNVDGAIAAVLSDLGWEPELGKGVFITARTPGLVAHVREEMENDGMRRDEGEYEP